MNSILNEWLIIADGPLLPPQLLQQLKIRKKIIALDGAAISCIDRNIIPDIVIGDFDVITKDFITTAQKKYPTQFIFLEDQDSTDLEKGIQFAINQHAHSITICQATGARLDHSLYNLRLLKRFYPQIKNVSIITEIEKVYFIRNKSVHLNATSIQPVALLSFPHAIVTSKGLKYDMQHLPLELGKQESTSNHLIASQAKITIQGDVLLIVSHETEVVFE